MSIRYEKVMGSGAREMASCDDDPRGSRLDSEFQIRRAAYLISIADSTRSRDFLFPTTCSPRDIGGAA